MTTTTLAERLRQRRADGTMWAYVVGHISAIVDSPSRTPAEQVAEIRRVLDALDAAQRTDGDD